MHSRQNATSTGIIWEQRSPVQLFSPSFGLRGLSIRSVFGKWVSGWCLVAGCMCHFGLVAISRTSCREAARREAVCVWVWVREKKKQTEKRRDPVRKSLSNRRIAIPVGGIMPGDMSPGTEWGMMWGFSVDVTLWVLFGGRPGLELQQQAEEERVGGGEEGVRGHWQRRRRGGEC